MTKALLPPAFRPRPADPVAFCGVEGEGSARLSTSRPRSHRSAPWCRSTVPESAVPVHLAAVAPLTALLVIPKSDRYAWSGRLGADLRALGERLVPECRMAD